MFDLGRFYKPSVKDIKTDQLTFFSEIKTSSASNTQVLSNHTAVPAGKILIIDSWNLTAIAGANQWPLNLTFGSYELDINTPRYLEALSTKLVAAFTDAFHNSLQKSHIILSTHTPFVIGNFNAGVAANVINSHLRGFLIPRGIFSP